MSELAGRLHLSPSGITRRIDGLVKSGLVERRPCPSDRRGSNAVLTPLGLKTLAQRRADPRARRARALRRPADRRQLAQLAAALSSIDVDEQRRRRRLRRGSTSPRAVFDSRRLRRCRRRRRGRSTGRGRRPKARRASSAIVARDRRLRSRRRPWSPSRQSRLGELDRRAVDVEQRDRVVGIRRPTATQSSKHTVRSSIGARVGDAVGADGEARVVVGRAGRSRAAVLRAVEREAGRRVRATAKRGSTISASDGAVTMISSRMLVERGRDLVRGHAVHRRRGTRRACAAARCAARRSRASPRPPPRSSGSVPHVLHLGDRVGELVGIGPEVGEVVEAAEDAFDPVVAVRGGRQRQRDVRRVFAPHARRRAAARAARRRVSCEALDRAPPSNARSATRRSRRIRSRRSSSRRRRGTARRATRSGTRPGAGTRLRCGRAARRGSPVGQRERDVGRERAARPEHRVVAREEPRRPSRAHARRRRAAAPSGGIAPVP